MAQLKLADIPELEGWVSVAKAAKIFGVHKESVYYMIHHQGLFEGVRRIGGDPSDPSGKKERTYLIIPAAEVERVRAEKAAAPTGPPLAEQIKEWNKRIKQWGAANGYRTGPYGRPLDALRDAYLAAHPDDPRPTRELRGPAYEVHNLGRDNRK